MEKEKDQTNSQTEKPTQRRLDKAKERGNLPQDKDFYHVGAVIIFFGFFWFFGDIVCKSFMAASLSWQERSVSFFLHTSGLRRNLLSSFWPVLKHIVIFFLGLWSALFFVGAVLQRGVRFYWDDFGFKLKRLSLSQGFKRIFSAQNLVESFKNVFKFLLVALCFVVPVWEDVSLLISSVGESAGTFFKLLRFFLKRFFWSSLIAIFFIALANYGYQWYFWLKKLLMSRQDIVDEQKETDKNPLIKDQQRRSRQTLVRMRLAKQMVPDATVLITNPSHYAVGIVWVPHKMVAPEVSVKGENSVALYMKKIAQESGVPVVENKSLARSLYATLQPGDVIHPNHYKAVAAVIRYVMNEKMHKHDAL